MNWLKTAILAGAALAATALGTANAADTLETIKQRGKLIVGADIGLPPYGMVDANMQPIGSDIEAARLLAADLGVPLEIVPATGPNRIPFLLTGKIDAVMASFSITPERKRVIDFSRPYGIIQIICAAPKTMDIKDVAGLAGKTLAVTRGTGSDMDATKLAKADPSISVVRFEDDATMITALATGQQNIMISALAQMNAINQKNPGRPIEPKFIVRTNGYAVGLRRDDVAFRERVNAWITKDLANGKLREVYKKYFGTDLPAELPME